MEPWHAEVQQVWPREGRVLVIGLLVGAGTTPPTQAGTLLLTDRDRPGVVLRCPATLNGRRFQASFDIDLIASAATLAQADNHQIWDLHLDVPGTPEPLRVGRHLDDIPNKKKVMTFPAQIGGTSMDPVKVKPYYTDRQNLSLICRRAKP